jgi:putative ABC transport system permease protein
VKDDAGPPLLAKLLLIWTTPVRYRIGVLGDVEEAFLLMAEEKSLDEACRWYWGQAIRSVAPALGMRLRRRGRTEETDFDLCEVGQSRHTTWAREWTMGAWMRHIRLAVRSLAKKPGFAALAIITLGLGIGANTAIFSVVYGSLLRALPYADVDRLVYLSDGHENFGGGAGVDQTIPNLLDLQAGSRLMQSSAFFSYSNSNLSADEQPERIRVLLTSSDLLRVLGVAPQRGRDFVQADDVAGAERSALITDAMWRRSFGADPDIIGRTAIIDAEPVRIVGVTPPDFSFPSTPDVLMTLQHVGGDYHRGNRNYNGIARLAPGATVEALRGELQGIFEGLVQQYPEENGDGWFTWADPIEDFVLGMNRQSLYLLSGAVLLVLLIACVNVANLLLVRAETRQREIAVRFALGAGRGGLLPHFLSEGLVLSVVGGAVGIVAAIGGIDLLVALYGGSLARAEEIEVNGTVLAFSLGVSLFVGLTVGLVPLLRAQPQRMFESLKNGDRGSSARDSRLGRSLVITEVALALVIVAGAGLLMNSMWRLQNVDLGLTDVDQMLTFQVSLPEAEYPSGDPVVGFYDALTEDLESIPGVEAVGFVNRLPLLGGTNTRISVWGDSEREANFVSFRPVTSGYFDALGVPLVSGRWLNAAEFADGTPNVLINETLARRLFEGEDPLGQRLSDWVEGGMPIVGVVGDVKGGGPTRPTPPAFYFPYAAFGGERAGAAIVRTAGPPETLIPHVRQAVERLDPRLPIYNIRTMADVAMERMGSRRFAMSLFGVFAGLSLLLGAIGIYGVMSFSVAKRSKELGVRLALGASRTSVMRLVLSQGFRLVAPGILIGLVLAVAAGRLLESLLFEVSALDPVTYLAVAFMLMLVGFVATGLPAFRATRVDPLTSIRDD